MLNTPNNTVNAIAQYFRQGHIAMTPSLTPKQAIHSLLPNGKLFDKNIRGIGEQVFPLNLPSPKLSASFNGSAALYQALKKHNVQSGDAVLLPAYCCGAEIGPFEYLQCNLYFFDIDNELNADLQQIEQLLNRYKDIKLLLLTHYLGFAQAHTKRIQQLCAKSDTVLLEDCAHALYGTHANKPLGSFGHSAIFSPRKTLGLLDGGLLVSNSHSELSATTTATANSVTLIKKPDLVPFVHRLCYSMQQYHRGADHEQTRRAVAVLGIALLSIPAILIKIIKKAGLLKKVNWATADIEGQDAIPVYKTSMSSYMYRLLLSSDSAQVKNKRQRNYHLWLAEMDNTGIKTKAKSVFPTLPEECCPLYFPLMVKNPAALVLALKSHDIEAFNWWHHMHPSVDWQSNPVAKKMKSQIIALPLHQQMSAAQIHHAATCVKKILFSSADL